MNLTRSLASLKTRLADALARSGIGPRAAWCRKQRHVLSTPGSSVVWVRGDAVPWAAWGARRGYFEVQFMDGLPYLRASAAPSL